MLTDIVVMSTLEISEAGGETDAEADTRKCGHKKRVFLLPHYYMSSTLASTRALSAGHSSTESVVKAR